MCPHCGHLPQRLVPIDQNEIQFHLCRILIVIEVLLQRWTKLMSEPSPRLFPAEAPSAGRLMASSRTARSPDLSELSSCPDAVVGVDAPADCLLCMVSSRSELNRCGCPTELSAEERSSRCGPPQDLKLLEKVCFRPNTEFRFFAPADQLLCRHPAPLFAKYRTLKTSISFSEFES